MLSRLCYNGARSVGQIIKALHITVKFDHKVNSYSFNEASFVIDKCDNALVLVNGIFKSQVLMNWPLTLP